MTPKTLATTAITMAACLVPFAASAATAPATLDHSVAAPRAESADQVLAALESRLTVEPTWSDEFKHSVL